MSTYQQWEAQAKQWLQDHINFSTQFKLHHLRAALKKDAGDELQQLGLVVDMHNLETPEGLMTGLKHNFVLEDDHSQMLVWLQAWYCDPKNALDSAQQFLHIVRCLAISLAHYSAFGFVFSSAFSSSSHNLHLSCFPS